MPLDIEPLVKANGCREREESAIAAGAPGHAVIFDAVAAGITSNTKPVASSYFCVVRAQKWAAQPTSVVFDMCRFEACGLCSSMDRAGCYLLWSESAIAFAACRAVFSAPHWQPEVVLVVNTAQVSGIINCLYF